MGPLVRCFVGFRIPQEFWPKIAETQMTIRKKSMSDAARWNSASELMLPLATLGEQPWEMVKRATSVLRPLCLSKAPLQLKLEGVVGLPNNTQPRWVAIKVAGDEAGLRQLQAEIAKALGPLLTPSEKGFEPQVPLGRLKIESEQVRTAFGRAVRMTQAEVLGEWTASAVELLRSEADQNGVHLAAVESFPLGAGVPQG